MFPLEAMMSNQNGNSLRILINENLTQNKFCVIENPRHRWSAKIIDEVLEEVRKAKWFVHREKSLFGETIKISAIEG